MLKLVCYPQRKISN